MIQVETTELDDYRWLASDDAEPYLERAVADERLTVSLVDALRRELSPARTHLVVAQIELRERARQKFGEADKMLPIVGSSCWNTTRSSGYRRSR